jgi:hypothetical protein
MVTMSTIRHGRHALSRPRPAEHVDTSSSLYFVAIASAYVLMRLYDYRPAPLRLGNLSSAAADLWQLPFSDSSVNSLSCMHVSDASREGASRLTATAIALAE